MASPGRPATRPNQLRSLARPHGVRGRFGVAKTPSPADPYARHLPATAAWLLRSIEHGHGGSCGYFSLLNGWSRPYPETTGYLIPTLLRLDRRFPGQGFERRALDLGSWLLDIQRSEGAWTGGLYRPDRPARPSVFNTAQVIQGMVALAEHTGEARWQAAAHRAARWLADGVGEDGLWSGQDYRAPATPSYYTYAAWPMLQVWERTDDGRVRQAAEAVLRAILARRTENGAFRLWGFDQSPSAYTHTIAYTIQGLLCSAAVLSDWATYGAPAEQGLTRLSALAERFGGRLPGRLNDDWTADAGYVCLTGNVQVALCLLDWSERHPEPERLIRTAAGLVDVVCDAQHIRAPVAGVRGGVAGSSPVWGRYMVLRYPNWAAKYLCDALLALDARQAREAYGSPGTVPRG